MHDIYSLKLLARELANVKPMAAECILILKISPAEINAFIFCFLCTLLKASFLDPRYAISFSLLTMCRHVL